MCGDSMEVVPLQQIPDEMLEDLVSNLHTNWRMLSPVEERLPFKDHIKNSLLHSHSIYYPFCVKYDDKLIGTFTLKEKDLSFYGVSVPSDTVWLMDLFVLQQYRKHGIGTGMINEAKMIAKSKGYKHMYVQCVKQLGQYFERRGLRVEYTMGAACDMPLTVVMSMQL